jgi:hypothetical protein
MGYTNYYAYQPSHPAYANAWPTILTDTRTIINRVRKAGIPPCQHQVRQDLDLKC